MSAPLADMHPLLYPQTVEASGLGPWLALPVALLVVALLLYIWHTRERSQQQLNREAPASPLEQALQQLASLQQPLPEQQAGPWLQQLNLLLKRFCAVHYPEVASHRLSGRDWLAFLDSRCPAAGLTRWMILVEGGYQPDCRLDSRTVAGIHQSVETWMRLHV